MNSSSILRLEMITESAEKVREIAFQVNAIIEGDFILASGKESHYYFEGKRIMSSPDGAYWVGRTIFEQVSKLGIDAIGGLATGAYPVATAVSLVSHLEERPIPWFVVRQPKSHGTRRRIEGHFTPGSKVVIIDDVITTGGSILEAIEAVEMEGCEVLKVISILDRGEGGSNHLRKKGYNVESIMYLDVQTGDISLTANGETGKKVLSI